MLHNYIFLVLIQFGTKHTLLRPWSCCQAVYSLLTTMHFCGVILVENISFVPSSSFLMLWHNAINKISCEKSENICIFLNTFNRPPRKDCACVSTIYKSCALMHLHLKRCKLNPFSETNCWHFWLLFTESTFQCSSNPVYFWGF